MVKDCPRDLILLGIDFVGKAGFIIDMDGPTIWIKRHGPRSPPTAGGVMIQGPSSWGPPPAKCPIPEIGRGPLGPTSDPPSGGPVGDPLGINPPLSEPVGAPRAKNPRPHRKGGRQPSHLCGSNPNVVTTSSSAMERVSSSESSLRAPEVQSTSASVAEVSVLDPPSVDTSFPESSLSAPEVQPPLPQWQWSESSNPPLWMLWLHHSPFMMLWVTSHLQIHLKVTFSIHFPL